MLKQYQPDRKEFLINTDWGIPRQELTASDAKNRGMVRFHGRWVSRAEKKQLSKEYQAYFTIRSMGVVLIALALYPAIGAIASGRAGVMHAAGMLVYALVLMATGIGLVRYRRFSRYPAVLVFISFLMLPFTPLLEDDKGAPVLLMLGAAGLYYLLRKTGRKIFWPRDEGQSRANRPRKIGPVRTICAIVVLMVILASGLILYGMHQGKRLATEACIAAQAGMPLDELMPKLSPLEYRIIRDADSITIVPKRGMGRNYCRVGHDGRNITGASLGVAD